MSIKTRLFIAFGFLVFLVIGISGIFIFYTQQTKDLLDRSVILSKTFFLWQDVGLSLDKQAKSMNYFLVLGEPSEKNKFEESVESVESKLGEISDGQEETEFRAIYGKYNELGKKMFLLPRPALLAYHDDRILPIEKSVFVVINSTVKKYSKLMAENEEKITKFSRINFIISILFGIFAIISGIVLGFVTFSSIWKPLRTLINGTREIGEGNLDHKINLGVKNEMGILAVNFNQMVENLKKLQLQIVQMDRMSSIGQLAGGVAHEINNPLTGVLGQTQLLISKTEPGDPAMQHLQRIEHAAQRCRRIVRALLDFAREKNYVFTGNSIEALINETLNFCETEIRSANVEIIKGIPADLPEVKVSSGHIQQVFLNVLNNAVHASAPKNGGKIIITARINSGYIDVSFKDTGVGISKENLQHVFDPFFTTKEVGSGTGLGLTVSYGIIQKHNGRIVAKSDGEGKGAEFIVSLPLKS